MQQNQREECSQEEAFHVREGGVEVEIMIADFMETKMKEMQG